MRNTTTLTFRYILTLCMTGISMRSRAWLMVLISGSGTFGNACTVHQTSNEKMSPVCSLTA